MIAFVGGTAWLLGTLSSGLSGNAYATPGMGKDCSKCHGSKSKDVAKAFKGFTDNFMTETCDGFSSEGTNPYFVLQPGYQLILEGKKKKDTLRIEVTVLDATKTFTLDLGDGVMTNVVTRVVQERESRNGVLAEISKNYFAICNRTNSVFYFGEDVDIYDATGTTVIDHSGSWLAGPDGARPGIAMPGVILVGGKYFQEVAPGLALDRSEIVSMTEAVETPAGAFLNCLQTLETSALEKGKGYKFYAPGIGLIRDDADALLLTQHGMVP